MAVTIVKYNQFNEVVLPILASPGTASVKLALVGSGYTFNATHTDWITHAEPYEITGTGYTAGGQALTNMALNGNADNGSIAVGDYWWDADDVTWVGATLTCRRGILYDATTGNLLASILFDDTPADVGVSAVDFVVQWANLGILQLD